MAKSIKKLPILGHVTLPVHIMHYKHKKDKRKWFQSGFAFFSIGDSQANVTDENGENCGTLGSCIGGHYQIQSEREDDHVTVIIDVQDIWNKVHEMFENSDVKVKFEGIEQIYKTYWDEYQKAQKEAEEKTKKLEELNQKPKKAEKKAEETKYSARIIRVTNNAGWDVSTPLPKKDWELESANKRIPPNFGCDIKAEYNGKTYSFYYKDKKPTVTLKITTWRGVSIGAMHYYGVLYISTPDMVDVDAGEVLGTPKLEIPIFSNDEIGLTQVLEEWEKERYPTNYEYLYPGDRHGGFYTQKEVVRKGKEIFKKFFGKGWKFEIDYSD